MCYICHINPKIKEFGPALPRMYYWVTKSKIIRELGHVACKGKLRDVYWFFVEKRVKKVTCKT